MPNFGIRTPFRNIHFSKRNSLKKKKIGLRINSQCTYIRNIHFCNMGPLVWKLVGLQYPNQYKPLFSTKDHCVRNSDWSVNQT